MRRHRTFELKPYQMVDYPESLILRICYNQVLNAFWRYTYENTYVIVFITMRALSPSPIESMKTNTTSIMTRYNSNSASAFLNLLHLKFLHRTILTPSARIPHQILKANITAKAMRKPLVGVRYANIELNSDTHITRIWSKVNNLSILKHYLSYLILPLLSHKTIKVLVFCRYPARPVMVGRDF